MDTVKRNQPNGHDPTPRSPLRSAKHLKPKFPSELWDQNPPTIRKTTGLEGIKRSLTIVVLTAVLMSSLINILNQLMTIVKAKNDNYRLETKVEELMLKQKELTEKVKESTTSSYQQAQAREMLGVGSGDDYWVVLPKITKIEGVYPELNEVKSKSNLEKWIGMFTD